ncbi:unnamed protein product [Lupinus luteus]|uniref:Uncharacterized protein n=1 Tax=Lupinus luteus TaxID=3873 RepID=A0AAV1XYN6_LUPLU
MEKDQSITPMVEIRKRGGKMSLLKMFSGFEKVGKRLKQNLSPKQKGDWKYLLMSL